MSFPSIIVHCMTTYTLYTHCTGHLRDHWNIRLLFRFITFCDSLDPFNQVVWQAWRLRFSYRKRTYIWNNIPDHPAYVVYMSQLIMHTRAYSSYGDFIYRGWFLTKTLIDQGYTLSETLLSSVSIGFGQNIAHNCVLIKCIPTKSSRDYN